MISGESLVNDCDSRTSLSVIGGEISPCQNGDSHRREESRGYPVDGRLGIYILGSRIASQGNSYEVFRALHKIVARHAGPEHTGNAVDPSQKLFIQPDFVGAFVAQCPGINPKQQHILRVEARINTVET